jgi:hypothetical protein
MTYIGSLLLMNIDKTNSPRDFLSAATSLSRLQGSIAHRWAKVIGALCLSGLLVALSPVVHAQAPQPAPVITTAEGEVKLDSMIAFSGTGLEQWYQTGQAKELDVFVDGVEIPGTQVILTKLRADWITVQLVRDATNDASRDAWNRVFGKSLKYLGGNPHMVDVTLGRPGELPLISNASPLPVVIVSGAGLAWWALAVVLLAVALFYLGKKSNLLRDDGPDPLGARKPFSLARTQMAFWLFVSVAAYLFILLVTGDTNTITESVLELIGISAATGFGAIVVDQAKTATTVTARDSAQKVADTLNAKGIANLAPEEQAARNQAIATVNRLNPTLNPTASSGFWWDIVSDGSGVSLHRFQIIVWTLVVGVVFARNVTHSLAMPDLSPTLLGLMGISGGTYVGFKIPENPT